MRMIYVDTADKFLRVLNIYTLDTFYIESKEYIVNVASNSPIVS
jgi:hypothetical protein